MVEAQLEDGVCLRLAEAVLSLVIKPGLLTEKDAEFLDLFLGELDGQQAGAGLLAVLGIADDLDEVIEIREGDEVALKLLGTGLCLAEKEAGATQDDLAAVLDEAGDGLLERKELRTTSVDGQH